MPFLARSLRSLLLLVAMLASSRVVRADLAVGAIAPAFELQDLDGKAVTLAEFRGKTVVLEWINPNCPVSRGYADRKVMVQTAAAHPEAVWLAINSTSRKHRDYLAAAAHKAYDAKQGIGYPVLYDTSGEVGRAYGAKTTPHMYVIDPSGKLVYAGAIDDTPSTDPADLATARNYVTAALDAALAGKPVATTTSTPYGCSVKY